MRPGEGCAEMPSGKRRLGATTGKGCPVVTAGKRISGGRVRDGTLVAG
jgi:hypothetical protein